MKGGHRITHRDSVMGPPQVLMYTYQPFWLPDEVLALKGLPMGPCYGPLWDPLWDPGGVYSMGHSLLLYIWYIRWVCKDSSLGVHIQGPWYGLSTGLI